MAKSIKTKFGFTNGQNFYVIVSATERNNSELLVFPSFADDYSEAETGNPEVNDSIKNQHYTIHNSPGSIENINVLKHTLEMNLREPLTTRIFTKAFKHNNLLAPLFISRCQDMSKERYIVKRDEIDNYVDLGNYYPHMTTLYYMVVVGNAGYSFLNHYKDINIISVDFRKYSIFFLWSFSLVPSHNTGSKSHFLTMPEIDCRLKEGFTEEAVINLYRTERQFLQTSFIEFIKQSYPNSDIDFDILNKLGFKRKSISAVEENDTESLNLFKAYDCINMANKEKTKGNSKRAIEFYNIAKGIFKEQNEMVPYAEIINSEGIIYHKLGLSNEAINSFQEASETFEKHGLFFQAALSILNLSNVYRDTFRIEIAIELANKSLVISQRENISSLVADANKELGVLYQNIGELQKAFDFLNLAFDQYSEQENAVEKAFCLGNMGLIKAKQYDFVKSLELHLRALKIFKESNDELGIANETANVGNTNCILGNFEVGLQQLKTALIMHQNYGYQYGVATDIKLLGANLLNKGEYSKAKEHLEKARVMFIRIGNFHEAEWLLKLLNQL